MKRFISLFLLLGLATCSFAQSATVIHITKRIEGEDLFIDPGVYPCEIRQGRIFVSVEQDGTAISGAQYNAFKKEKWSAAQGHGYVHETKRTVVRAQPNDKAKIIARLQADEDCYPNSYDCLGVSGNWYKILYVDEMNNRKVGYVKKNMVEWHIHISDCAGCIR